MDEVDRCRSPPMPQLALRRLPLVSLTLLVATLLAFGLSSHELLAASPAAGGLGALSVSSDPAGAAVYVDGDFVGQTPISIPSLAAGDHRVRVVKDGYLDHQHLFKVAQDGTNALQVRLTPRATQNAPAQAGGLRIVVIQGEDSVNIIQQRTAVATIVEGRDRNNLPVSGASVVFLLSGGGRTAVLNNGLNQVAVTT